MISIFHSQMCWTAVQHSAPCSTLFYSCFVIWLFFWFGLKLHLKNIFFTQNVSQIEMPHDLFENI